MSKEAVGVSRKVLIDAEILPPDEVTADTDTYIPITDFRELYKVLHLVAHSGENRERFGENAAENDRSFQQLIMYGVVMKDDRFLVYQRGKTGNYSENRLAGKLSLGVGGHMEPSDSSLPQSMYREFDEEVEVVKDGKIVTFPPDNIGRARTMREYVSITPVGLIKDERDDVGKVHLGLVSIIKPKDETIDIRIRTETGENVASQYVNPQELQDMTSGGSAALEGWGDIVLRNELLPRLDSGSTEHIVFIS